MVPENLNDNQKACQNEVSAETLERLETEPDFLNRVIRSYKSWFFECCPEVKRQNEGPPQAPRQKKARMSK
jgi:hypothetical protein